MLSRCSSMMRRWKPKRAMDTSNASRKRTPSSILTMFGILFTEAVRKRVAWPTLKIAVAGCLESKASRPPGVNASNSNV